MWLGLGPTLMRDVPFSGIYWSVYELCKNALNKTIHAAEGSSSTTVPVAISFASGATAGTLAAVITTPIDLVKTRIQVAGSKPTYTTKMLPSGQREICFNGNNYCFRRFSHVCCPPPKPTALGTFKSIVREEGWTGLFRGIVPRAARVAPACAIMISSYEFVKGYK
eukprot:TRINITY_DN5096_c0_g1_i4.p1 TRINITY_DN5096_c0_g1~~TRINITY_DN5096_c0_g1_i4.p1  ORF type:complete len:166 (+),score=28.62 TRINITY_DN5096_c0_g1_i4:143-640(+)